MNSTNHLTASIKMAGLRLTPQRMAICRLLSETDEHPTAARIYDEIRVQYPSLSLMTVYNTLNALVELGAVNELGNAGDGNIHYDGETTPHINLACINCHRIVDVDYPGITNLDQEIAQKSGFKLVGSRMMYYGLCPACQDKKDNQERN
jgi:Fur family peroxide stress response transcriptional regulator